MNPFQFPRCTPESQGISSAAIFDFVTDAGENIHELHSLMLVRHGAVVAEGWWAPYAAQRPHMLFSLSKSFTSTAIGFAVDEGRLSIDDKVLSFFPEDAPAKVSENLAALRVRDLLTMSVGHAKDATYLCYGSKTWKKAFLSEPIEFEPGTHFVYNSLATYMLSAIVQKVSGEKLIDYLRPRLFEPLGITGARWETSPEGINTGGWGLSIKTEDLARFGQLYLQKGLWNGRRVVPESWIAQATRKQIDNSGGPDTDWSQGYGFQFWRCQHGAFRGDGAFGQYCVVMPEQDAVLIITSGTSLMQPVLDRVWGHLLTAMKPAALPEDPQSQARLANKLSSLALLPPQSHADGSETVRAVSGKTFTLEPNPLNFNSVTFKFAATGCTLLFRTRRGAEHVIQCGYGAWQDGTTRLSGAPRKTVASGTWTDPGTFEATLRYFETPFFDTFTCRFSDSQVEIRGITNVSLDGNREYPLLVGHLV